MTASLCLLAAFRFNQDRLTPPPFITTTTIYTHICTYWTFSDRGLDAVLSPKRHSVKNRTLFLSKNDLVDRFTNWTKRSVRKMISWIQKTNWLTAVGQATMRVVQSVAEAYDWIMCNNYFTCFTSLNLPGWVSMLTSTTSVLLSQWMSLNFF